MSISSFINSPKPVFTLKNLYLNGAGIAQAINADDALVLQEIVCDVGNDAIYLSVPAGTYDARLVASIQPYVGATPNLGSVEIRLIDDAGVVICSISSQSFYSLDGTNTTLYFDQTQRITLTTTKLLTLQARYSNITGNAYFQSGSATGGIDRTARFELRQTF